MKSSPRLQRASRFQVNCGHRGRLYYYFNLFYTLTSRNKEEAKRATRVAGNDCTFANLALVVKCLSLSVSGFCLFYQPTAHDGSYLIKWPSWEEKQSPSMTRLESRPVDYIEKPVGDYWKKTLMTTEEEEQSGPIKDEDKQKC